ncbi:monovalent cation/H(+) antiporter subunit G [Actinomadura rayongensis]|uniref:Na+/H+ antiporter subunit G n=1 Tax=Actinomadura rayongensis TaxID=1429076 RepID=A0A6I4W5K0_9ACTN|nr:Na+/H+ antiporter subunit G [Actinomadura rayongensis]
MSAVADVALAGCLLVGAFAALSAGLGLLTLPDLLTRMHAATKPQAVGVVLILIAVGIRHPTVDVITTLVLIALLQLTTVPVAAHLVGRSAYRTGQVRSDLLYTDELRDALDRGAPPEDLD